MTTKLELPDPSPDDAVLPWPLRVSDIDLHGHVNNAVYWQAVEHVLPSAGIDPGRPLVAELDYRAPIDLDDAVELVASSAGGNCWQASAPRTGSGRWRGWVSDSVAPGGALCLLVAGAMLAADRALVDAVPLAGDEVDVAGADLRLANDPRIGPRRGRT